MKKIFNNSLYKSFLSKIEGRESLQKILVNTSWLFSDKVLRMAVGLFVGVWLARYLGPELYGVWNYAIAFVAIFTGFAALGLDSVIIRDIVIKPGTKYEILGTAFALKLISGIIALIAAIVFIYVMERENTYMLILVAIIALGGVFQSFDVIDFYFQSQLNSKYTVYSRNISFLIFTCTKIYLILTQADLILFVWATTAEICFSALFLLSAYRLNQQQIFQWKISMRTAKELLTNSWPLLLAFVSYIIYSRIDQVMIGKMLDSKAAGIYSASTRIYEIPLVLVLVVTSSLYPKLNEWYLNDRTMFYVRYAKITSYFTFASYIVLAGSILFGRQIIAMLFGELYSESYDIFIIQIFGMIFMYNAALRSSYMTITSNQKTLLYTTVMSAAINILLNFILIPLHGIKGAALATVIAQFLSLFLLNFFFQNTKQIFSIQLKSLYLNYFLTKKIK